MKDSSRLLLVICFLSLASLTACARPPAPADAAKFLAYTIKDDGRLTDRYLPVLLVEDPQDSDNLIGTARATKAADGSERVIIDPTQASIYRAEQSFSTAKGSYTNHIYRIHFPRVPLKLIPFHLGAGENIGILVIVTVNTDGQPVLFTTLHTCGCYLAFVPTTFLRADAFPTGWPKDRRQSVYLQSLPGIIDFSAADSAGLKPYILIKSGTHRIMDIQLADPGTLQSFTTRDVLLQPMALLDNIPIPGGGTTSFYETTGARKGYVKGNRKIWERLFMSWWALDWRVGEDKGLDFEQGKGPVFYTSLKPWARQASDLRNFPAFLRYWGWRL